MQSSLWLSWFSSGKAQAVSAGNRRRWRRGALLSSAIALVLFTSGSQIQADTFTPAPGQGQTAYIAPPPGYNVNIRSGPGTQYAAVNTLRPGTAIALTGRYQNGWAELSDGSWVAGNLISRRPLGSGGDGSLNYTATIATPAGYNLNIRSGPGTQYPAVNTLARGTTITVTNRYDNGWVQLADGGWAAGNFVQIGGAIAPSQPTASAPPTPQPTNDGTLTPGSQGSAVTNLQNRLLALGYLPANYTAAGTYDATTAQAVSEFQRFNNLTADGVAGPDTLNVLYSAAALNKASGGANTLSPSPSPAPTATGSPSPSPTGTGSPSPSPSPTTTGSPSPSPTGTVSPSPSPSPTGTGNPTAPQSVRVQTDTGMDMPIFSGPGTEYELIEFLPDGSTVRVTGQIQGNWAELEDGNWAYVPWLAY